MSGKPAAKNLTWIWFNSSDEDLRSFLLIGIRKIIALLKKLTQKALLNTQRKTLEAVLAKDGKSVPMPLQRSVHLKWMTKKYRLAETSLHCPETRKPLMEILIIETVNYWHSFMKSLISKMSFTLLMIFTAHTFQLKMLETAK